MSDTRYYLIVDVLAERAWLAADTQVIRPRSERLRPIIVMDLIAAARGFARVAGPEPEGGYTAWHLASYAGVVRRRIDEWTAQGILPPARPGSRGRGHAARWTRHQAYTAGVLGALWRQRVESVTILRAVARLMDQAFAAAEQPATPTTEDATAEQSLT